MATTNAPPSASAQKSGGSGTYIIGIILLALAMGAVWFLSSGDEKKPTPTTSESAAPPPPPPAPIHAPPPPPEIEEEEDAGTDAGDDGAKKPVGGGKGSGLCSNCGKGKSSAALNSALSAMAGSAKGCYNRALRTSAVSGTLTVSVQVGSNGTVCGASVVNDSVGSPEINSCVVGRFSGKQFPPPESGCVVVNIPIAFKIKE